MRSWPSRTGTPFGPSSAEARARSGYVAMVGPTARSTDGLAGAAAGSTTEAIDLLDRAMDELRPSVGLRRGPAAGSTRRRRSHPPDRAARGGPRDLRATRSGARRGAGPVHHGRGALRGPTRGSIGPERGRACAASCGWRGRRWRRATTSSAASSKPSEPGAAAGRPPEERAQRGDGGGAVAGLVLGRRRRHRGRRRRAPARGRAGPGSRRRRRAPPAGRTARAVPCARRPARADGVAERVDEPDAGAARLADARRGARP